LRGDYWFLQKSDKGVMNFLDVICANFRTHAFCIRINPCFDVSLLYRTNFLFFAEGIVTHFKPKALRDRDNKAMPFFFAPGT
jgi:hypothetical protein